MSTKINSKRPPTATTPNDRTENKSGLSAIVSLLLSPVRRNRVAQTPAAVKSSVNIPASSQPSNASATKTSSRPNSEGGRRTTERRKSLQAMLGSDAVFNSFIAVAQKVFNVPIAVVCHVQTGPGTSTGS